MKIICNTPGKGRLINPHAISNATPMNGLNSFESYHAFNDANPELPAFYSDKATGLPTGWSGRVELVTQVNCQNDWFTVSNHNLSTWKKDAEVRQIYIALTPAPDAKEPAQVVKEGEDEKTLCGVDCECKTGEDCHADPIGRLFETEESGRNWTEDFTHENGNYNNTCMYCDKNFIGHKRRIVCKLCDIQPTTQPVESVEELANELYRPYHTTQITVKREAFIKGFNQGRIGHVPLSEVEKIILEYDANMLDFTEMMDKIKSLNL